MRRRNNEKNKFIVLILMLFVLAVGIGYAVLTEKLTINNTISYDSMKWDVGFTATEDGFEPMVDKYIEIIESEFGMTLEELGMSKEELKNDFNGDRINAISTSSISPDKKSITVNCNLEMSSKPQTCWVKATISNASTFNISISDLQINYDDTYIYDTGMIWLNHELFGIISEPVEVVKGQTLDVGEIADILIIIDTKELTEDILPTNDLSIPVTISLDFEEAEVSISKLAMLTIRKDDFAFWSDEYREKIKNITFEDKINVPDEAFESWDISLGQTGKVMSYVVPNQNDSSYYDLYIQSDTQLYANFNMQYWFENFTNIDSINGLDLLKTSYTNDMHGMFASTGYNSTIFTLDVSNFDTSNVTDMSFMFDRTGYNSTIFALDVSNFDTSKVTSMYRMLALTGVSNPNFTLDVSNFDTSNVTNMGGMFVRVGEANKFFTLDVSNFDTSNVTNMGSMFSSVGYNNPNFTLDVSNFDTSNVTNMSYMFSETGYNSKTFTLDLSNFDTSKVTNMSWMFRNTGFNSERLTLNLNSFDTSKVTSMLGMFESTGYNSIFNTLITIKNPNTTDYNWMFEDVATKSGSKITVNYTSETESLVDDMIATKSYDSNVVKGVRVD